MNPKLMCHGWNLKQKVKLKMEQREEKGTNVDGIKEIVSYDVKFIYESLDSISPDNILNSSFHSFGGKEISLFQPNEKDTSYMGHLAHYINV